MVSFDHDVVCTSIDGLPLWYLLVMMLSVLLRLTAYPFGIFWSWCCLYFFDWWLTPLVSFGHDVFCTSIAILVSFGHDVVCTSSTAGLPLWYLLAMVLSVLLRLTAYPFGIFWSWCCLYFFDWRLIHLVSFGHDAVCTSSIDGLPLWYLLVMMLSVLLRLSSYPFVSFGHDVVCTSSIDVLSIWYLLVMMPSVLLRLTAYPFGIFWSWCCLYFFDCRLTPLVSLGHDVVCTSSIDGLLLWYLLVMMWSVLLRLTLTPLVSFVHDVVCTSSIDGLPLWYLLVMMLSVLLRLTAYPFGIFWSWCCLYFFDWQLTPLVSFGHDVVCTSSIDRLPLWYLLVMMLSVLLRLTVYPFGIFWSLCCLYFFDWRLTPLVFLVMMLSVLLRLTTYPFGIFWSWCCLYFFDWRLTPLVSFGHDVVCTSSIDGLPLWYLLVMMLSVLLRLTAYPFGIFWSWCCLYFFDWRLTPLVSFGHDVVCTSSIDGLSLWYLLVMMLSVLLRLMAYPFGIFWSWCCLYFCDWLAYPFGISWSWCCLYFFDWRLTPLVSFGHDVVCTSSINGLPLWYLLVMMLSVLRRLTAYPFGIFWSWCCLYFFDWRLTPLVSFGHDVVCTSSIDGLPLWYLLVMMLSVLLRLMAYPFGIFWSWCCLYFFDWRLNPLVSFGHDVVCTSINGLPLWYLLVMLWSVLLRLTAYPFGILWSWCCLYFFDWRLTTLVSFGHDVVCTSSIDGLTHWYLLVMMLSVLRLTAYPFGIFWSWCCLYFFDWQLTPLVSFGHDVVCTSSIDSLPLWYLLVMMLSVLLRLTAYPFGIFWSWCCLYFFDWRLTLWYLLVMMLSVLLWLTAYPFGIFWSWCFLYFCDWRLTPLVSFGHDVVCTSLTAYPFGIFWSWLMAYPFGIFWSWCCLYFFDWRLIFWSWCCLYFFDWRLTPLVSFGHDVVCTSSIDGLPLWYLLVMMLSVLLRLTAYPFGIFWSWCCLYFFDWQLTPLVSFGHDVVCTSINDPFGIFWSWCCLHFFDWQLTPLVSFGHDVVCTSSIDGLPLWYLLVMMLSVLLRLTAYPFGIFWSWCCLYFFDWQLTPLVSFGHDVVCTSAINGLPFWYLLVMMLSVLLRLTAYPFGIFWSWCCLYFFDWLLVMMWSVLLTPLVSFGHDVVCTSAIDGLPLWYLLVMMLSVLLRLMAYPFGIFWSWCCLYFFDWQLTPLVYFGHCTSIDGLLLWYLLVMMLSYFFDWQFTPLVSWVMMLSVLLRLTAYPFGIFWSWCCLYFFDWRLTHWYLLVMMLSVLRLTAYPFGIFWSWCVCTSSIDGLPLWYLLVMMLSVLLRLTAYPFGIFWSWCCLYFFDWRLPLWYLLVMMLSVLRLTAYPFGIFWSWCCLYFFDWQLTPLVSFGHDVVCTSSIDAYPFGIFWSWCCLYFFDWQLTPLVSFGHDVVCTSSIDSLPLWYLLVMMLSVLLRLTAYPFGIFWSWCCLYFCDWRLTPLVSFGHDAVCTSLIDVLPLWYLLVMMWSVLLRLTAYPFGISWSWCCLYFFDWRLPLWYLLVMMWSVLLRLTAYPFGIFWSWCCLYFCDWRLTPLVSFGHDVVCTSSIDGLPLWYLLVMMLSVLLRLTAYPFGIFWSWCCLYFFDWRLTLWYLLVMMLSVLLRLTAYPFGIFWSWCCLYFFDWRLTLWYLLVMMLSVLRLTAYPLVSFGHDVVCTSSIDCLPLWYLLVMMLSVLLRLTAYPFGIFWSWCCLYFDWRLTPLVSFGHDVVCTSSIDGLPLWYLLVMMLSVLLRLTLTPLVSFGHDVVCTSSIDGLPLWYLLVMMLSVLLRLTAYPLVSFGHDVVCTSSIDGLPLWYLLVMMLSVLLRLVMMFSVLPIWYLLVMMLSVLLRLTAYRYLLVMMRSVLLRLMAYPFGIFWSWCCLYFFDWRLTPLVSFGHDVVCTSSIDGLPLWYLLVMMLSVLLRLTAYPFGIFWSWCCLYFFDWRLTPLVSFGHDVVCTSSIDGLPLWYLLVMMLSVLLRLTAYPLVSFGHDVVCTSSIDSLPLWYLLVMMLSVLLRLTAYPFGIFWSWCCLYFFDWRLTPLVSFGHDVVCTSSIDGLPLWYLLVMMLSVLLRLTAYPFGIFWSWCCLYFFDWRLTPLVSFGHDVVCTSSIDGLPFGIFWSWCCLYFFDWQLTPLVSFGHDVVCTSSIDGLPLWYLLVMMLSVLLRLTAYPFGIFWSWCCLYFFTPLVSFGHDVVWLTFGLPLWYIFWFLYFFDWLLMMLSVLLFWSIVRLTHDLVSFGHDVVCTSSIDGLPFGIFWSSSIDLTPLVLFMMLSVYFFDWRLTPLVSLSFGHDVVCTSSIDGLPLWHLLVMMLSVLLRLTAYPFGIFWSWCCLYFFDWRLTPLVSFGHDVVCTSAIDGLPLWYLLVMMLSVLLRLTAYPFGIFWSWCFLYLFDCRLTPLVSFGHDVVCTSIDGLLLWYLLVMMLSVLLWLPAYPFGIFWSWCCLYFFDCRLTPLVSFGHDVVCTSSIDWLTPLVSFGHDVVCTSSIDGLPFGIFWSWCCLYFFDWQLTPLVSFGHDVVCTSSINGLPLWYLLVMMFSVLVRLPAYPFGIFWSWCCLYFFDWLLTPLVSFGHDVVCTSSIDSLPFGIFWSWCCLYFFDWWLTPLVSFGHDVVCTSSIDSLPLWYLLVMMLSVLRLTAYPFGIFWSWCCLYFFDWLLTPLVSFGHDVVCTSSIDGFPLWYLLVMMLCVLLRLTAYPFGIFWSWCCL